MLTLIVAALLAQQGRETVNLPAIVERSAPQPVDELPKACKESRILTSNPPKFWCDGKTYPIGVGGSGADAKAVRLAIARLQAQFYRLQVRRHELNRQIDEELAKTQAAYEGAVKALPGWRPGCDANDEQELVCPAKEPAK